MSAQLQARWADPLWRLTAAVGATLLLALGLAQASQDLVALVLAGAATTAIAGLGAVRGVRALRAAGPRVTAHAVALLGLIGLGLLLAAAGGSDAAAVVLAITAVLCGLGLIGADLHRRSTRAARAAGRTPWQRSMGVRRALELPWRAATGAGLIAFTGLGVVVAVSANVGTGGTLWLALVLLVGVVGAALIALPVLVGAVASADRARLTRAREEERLLVAAHLHDSVLQTLSLVQRQAADPAAVTRLARHQERALRAWMAGREEPGADTYAGAIAAVVEEVERDEDVTVEASVLGDGPLDARGEALVAALREALRNGARHARGTALVVFAEIGEDRAAAWVRDEGPGFDLAAVDPARRGVRDAVLGRMASVGGSATIDSAPGEGTEIGLVLPAFARSAA